MKSYTFIKLAPLAVFSSLHIIPATAGVLDFEDYTVGEIAGQSGWTAGVLSNNSDGIDAYAIIPAGIEGSNGLRILRDTSDDDFSSVFWTPDAAFLGSDLINADGGQRYAYSFDIDLVNPDTGTLGGNKTSIRIYLGGAVQTANNNATGYAAIAISNTGQVSQYGEGPGSEGLSLTGFNTISGVIDFGNMTQTIFINDVEYAAEGPFELGVGGGVVDPDVNATFGSIAILMRLQDLEMVIDNFSITQLPPQDRWAGYLVNDGGFADTDGWLGWVWADSAPNVFVYNIAGWVYIDEAYVEEEGGWAYIYR